MEKLSIKQHDEYTYEKRTEILGKKFEELFEKIKIKMNQQKADERLKQIEEKKKKIEELEKLKLKEPHRLSPEEKIKVQDYVTKKPFISLKTELDEKGVIQGEDVVIKKTQFNEESIESFINNNKLFYEKYFAGNVDETEIKFQGHLKNLDSLIDEGFHEVEKNMTYKSYHEVEGVRKVTEEYKLTSQDENFYKLTGSYAFTEDMYKIDAGLIISRPPIFIK